MKTLALPTPGVFAPLLHQRQTAISVPRPILFWLISFSPTVLALMHLTIFGRASYVTHTQLFLSIDAFCSILSSIWLASRFGGTRVAFISVTLLLSIAIFVINWTIFAGGCCQTPTAL